MLGIFVGALTELPGYNIWMIQRQVDSKVVAFLKIAFRSFFKILCSESFVASVESSEIW